MSPRRKSASRSLAEAALAAALALAPACGSSAPSAEVGRDAAAAAIPVATAPARVRTVDRSIAIVGTLAADREVHLAAEVDGQVKDVLVDLGDRVKAGQVIARIDPDMSAASYREADARLRNAEADAKRAESLHEEGVISPQEYDRLKSALDTARAGRDLLALKVDRATVRAPIDGAVAARSIERGDYARAGTALFTIVSDRVLRLRGEVPERLVSEVAAGLEVRGEVDALPGSTVVGKVVRLNAALDPKNRTLTVEAEVDNSEGKLRPGFFVRGTILTQRGVSAVSVPSEAIVTFAGVSHVFVFQDGVARSREVAVGERFEEDLEILSGVKEGERVIVSGLTRLHDGTPVRLADAAAKPAGTS